MAMNPGGNASQAANRQQRKNFRTQIQSGDEIGEENVDMSHLAFKEQFTSKFRNRPGFAELRRVLVGEFSHQLPFCAGDELRSFAPRGNVYCRILIELRRLA